MLNVETVKKMLGNYAELFDYMVREGYVIAKPKKRIDPETFSDIGKLVRGKGEYVKWDKVAKKGGYFRFKGETAVSAATLDTNKNNLYKDLWAYADDIEKHVVKQVGIVKEKLRLLGYKGN